MLKKKEGGGKKKESVSINICNIHSLSVKGSQAKCVAQIKGLISTVLTSYSVSSGSGLMGRLCGDSAGARSRLNRKTEASWESHCHRTMLLSFITRQFGLS